jgi:hypothetical protein
MKAKTKIRRPNRLAGRIRRASTLGEKFKLALYGCDDCPPEIARLLDTWMAVRAAIKKMPKLEVRDGITGHVDQTAEKIIGSMIQGARDTLDQLTSAAMLRDDAEFFKRLAHEMEQRRKTAGESIADRPRAFMATLLCRSPKLSNSKIAEEFKKYFPDNSDRVISRYIKELST